MHNIFRLQGGKFMKFKESFPTTSIEKETTAPLVVCLCMFLGGCLDDTDNKPSGTDGNQSKKAEAMVPKAFHDKLMAEHEAKRQELSRQLELLSGELQAIQAEREKLLSHLEQFNELKQALVTTREELNRVMAEAEAYKTSALAASGAGNASSAQTIRQLTVNNTQLSRELATSKQRVGQLELSVSRIQNPANMLKIRQLTLEKTYLSKELATRDKTIQGLQASLTGRGQQDNSNTVLQLKAQNTQLVESLATSEKRLKEVQDLQSNPRNSEFMSSIRQLKAENSKLTQSLARSEKRVKDMQALQKKPKSQVDPNLIPQLKAQNASLTSERDRLKQQLLALSKNSVKTLAEWKTKLRSQGLMNIQPTRAQLAASIGKPHDKVNSTASGAGNEATFIWRDYVKVDLEIRTVDGKIETVSYDK